MAEAPNPNQPNRDDGAVGEGRSRLPGLSPLGELLAPNRRRRAWTDEERAHVIDELFFEGERRGEFLARFFWLIVLSSAIAALGLLSDSAAVVIGAMLVAPLMTPILAVAAALITGQVRRMSESLLVVLAGALLAIGVGWLTAKAAGGALTSGALTDELAARTAPGLLDLGIAIAAGGAAAYILTNRGASSALPGVAIAVALVPPLATAGAVLELAGSGEAEGALLLFSTNLVAIVLSAVVVLALTGFAAHPEHARFKKRIRIGLVLTTLATAAIAVPLAIHTFRIVAEERLLAAVGSAVEVWDPAAEIRSVDVDREGSTARIELTIASPADPAPAWRLAELLRDREDLDEVVVSLRHVLESTDEATTLR